MKCPICKVEMDESSFGMISCLEGHFILYSETYIEIAGYTVYLPQYSIRVWFDRTIIQDLSCDRIIMEFNYPLFFELEDDGETISISRLLNRVSNLIPFS